MGQRTQLLVNIKTDNINTNQSFALHNQRGYGRPLVSSVLGIAKWLDQLPTGEEEGEFNQWNTYSIDRRSIYAIAQRPFGLDELFSMAEPYDCSSEFRHDEHDNNNGYAIVNIDIPNKQYDVSFHDYDGTEYDAWGYIQSQGCEDYCHDVWMRWFETNKCLLPNKQD